MFQELETMEKKLLGVCLWLSEKTNSDVAIIRLIWVIAALFFGTGILAYLVIFLLIEFNVLE